MFLFFYNQGMVFYPNEVFAGYASLHSWMVRRAFCLGYHLSWFAWLKKNPLEHRQND